MDVTAGMDAATLAIIESGDWVTLWEPAGGVALLNHGSYGRPLLRVRDLQQRIRREIDADPARYFRHSHSRLISEAAAAVHARLQIPDGHAVAFRRNASTAVIDAVGSLAAPDRPILVTNLAYGGVRIGLEALAGDRGIDIATVELPDLAAVTDIVDIVAASVDRLRPGVVLIDQIASATACLLPAAELVARIKEASPESRVVVDAAHSPGMLRAPFVPGADAWVANLHKWVCAPHGAAVIAAPAGSGIAPLQRSWTGRQPFPDSFLWTGTDDTSAFLVAPTALDMIEALVGNGLDGHISAVLEDAAGRLSSAWDVPADARPPGRRSPWMRLIELPGPVRFDHGTADVAIAAVRSELSADIALSPFGERGYLRLSAHGYNRAGDYGRLTGLPDVLARLR